LSLFCKDVEDALKQQKDAEEKTADDAVKTAEDLIKEKKKLDEDYTKSKKEKDKDIRDASIDLARDSINAVFEMQNQKFEKELSDLDIKKNKELSNKNLTESQKAKIEADYEKKANAIKTKQAQNDKKQALFNAIMNTAVQVTAKLANPILAAIIAALGAVQIATIMAQPIPKFAKGTMSAPGMGIFGEAGRELMFLRSGETMLADKATYFEGSKFKGAKIFSNPETERMIGMSNRNLTGQSISDERLINEMREVKKAILNKPVAIYDKDHRQIGLGNSQHQTIYLNRLINRN